MTAGALHLNFGFGTAFRPPVAVSLQAQRWEYRKDFGRFFLRVFESRVPLTASTAREANVRGPNIAPESGLSASSHSSCS